MSGRILHFGLGSFARAHLCDYTQDAGGWTVTGVSLRSAAIRDGLAAQGFVYGLHVQGQGRKEITCVDGVMVASEDPRAVLKAVASVDLISATVTEKGYHLDADGKLDLTDPAIAEDLQGTEPQTLIGFLAYGLASRTRPVTVLSCDNRVGNGDVLAAAVQAFAVQAGLDVDWTRVSFPNAMVDRITPATTDAFRAQTGDPMAVPTEPFREWVIEDNFAGPCPDWPDVQMVHDVGPHELRKLRMLNGAHSFLAYAGTAAGHSYVHEAIADPVLRATTQALMRDAGATLPDEVRDQVGPYADALIKRFENPHLRHKLRQIAMDGSQKVPYRFVGTLRDSAAAGHPSAAIVQGLRAWIKFCSDEVKAGRLPDDPMAQEIADAVRGDDPVKEMMRLVGAKDLSDHIR